MVTKDRNHWILPKTQDLLACGGGRNQRHILILLGMPRGRVQTGLWAKWGCEEKKKNNSEILESSTSMVQEWRSTDGRWRVRPTRPSTPCRPWHCLSGPLVLRTSDLMLPRVNVSCWNSELKQSDFLCCCCSAFSWEIKMYKFPWKLYVFLLTIFFLPNELLKVLSCFTLPPSLQKPWLVFPTPFLFHDGDSITSSLGSWSSG